MTRQVVVVGAGMAGVTAARALEEHGMSVLVVEAASQVGGRMSTGLIEGERVDDGVPCFTASDPAFRNTLAPFIEQGDVFAWPGRWHRWEENRLVPEALMGAERRFLVRNGAAALVAGLAEELNVLTSTRADRLSVESGAWSVHLQSGAVVVAAGLVLATPAPEAFRLARTCANAFNPLTLADVGRASFDPGFVVNAGYEHPAPPWQAVSSEDGAVSWMGVAQRSAAQTVVTVIGSAAWSRAAFDGDKASWARSLLGEASVMGGDWLQSPRWIHTRRWSHARPAILAPARAPASEGFGPPAVFCGDWCAAPRVEGAYLSGAMAGQRLAYML